MSAADVTVADVEIRPERASEANAIFRVQLAAFGKEPEARIVERMRGTDRFVRDLSLVAEIAGALVGHVLVTYTDLATEAKTTRIPLLGPLGVLPEHQGAGVGSALMRAALAAVDARGEPLVVLEGSPAYYGRFGFVPAAELGIEAPPGVPAAFFHAVRLRRYDAALRGTVHYPPPFAAFVT